MANRFLNNIKINDSYTLPNADGAADQVIKTDGLGNLSFTDIIATNADKALSLTLQVKNTESVALTKGQVVCAAPTATPPSGNVIEVKLADNNGTDSMPAIGVLNEGLDAAGGANDEGEAIMFGRISGINTSAFSVGDEVFVSDTPGGLTATKPTGVKYIQKVGVIMRDDATNGTIEVFGAGRTNDVPTPLYIDHANQRLGIGTTSPQSLLHVSSTAPIISLTDTNSFTDPNDRLIFRAGANEGLIQWYDSSASSTSTIAVFESGGNVGIGTTSTSGKLDVRQAQQSTPFTSPFLKLYPSSTTNTSGHTTITLGTSTVDNYGVSLSGWRYGTDGDPKFRIKMHNNSSAGIDAFTIDSSGKVGIGITGPASKLHVKNNDSQTSTAAGITVEQSGTGDAIVQYLLSFQKRWTTGIDNSDGDKFKISQDTDLGTNNVMTLDTGGNVGIGDTTPSYKLDVNGTIRATGDVIAYSDIRVKENITTIEKALDKVKKLRGVEYNKIDNTEKSIGVIAQEIEEVIPEVVKEDDQGMKSVAYGNITAVLIEAIKEQQKQIDELKAIINGGSK